MDEHDEAAEGLRARISARGEEALGEFAQALLENPLLNQAISAAFGAREVAASAQKSAMEALNLPSAADLERLERRLRALSERLEDTEEQLDRLASQVAGLRRERSGGPESVAVESEG